MKQYKNIQLPITFFHEEDMIRTSAEYVTQDDVLFEDIF